MNTKIVLNIEPYTIDYFTEKQIGVFTCMKLDNTEIDCIGLEFKSQFPDLQEVEVKDELHNY